ncbi:MAG: hypothetical protein K5770_09800, partial [Lachnospiraceae bacterium]|nr:hypothetical protein [Lachnospiraceae bacterium]
MGKDNIKENTSKPDGSQALEEDSYEWDLVSDTGTWQFNTREIEESIINSTLMQDEELFIEASKREFSEGKYAKNRTLNASGHQDPPSERISETAQANPLASQGKIPGTAQAVFSDANGNEAASGASDRVGEELEKAVKAYKSKENKNVSPNVRQIYEAYDRAYEQSKKGPSEFRKRSADWRDGSGANPGGGGFEPKKIPVLTWVCIAMAVVILITGIRTTSVYAEYKGQEKKALAMASLNSIVEADTEETPYEVYEEEIQEAAEEPEEEEVELKSLSLVLSSVEKDLKIKLVDEDETLVKNVPWSVIVTDGKGNEETDEDDDEDGIIHLTGLSAGDYSVAINPSDSLAGYVLPDSHQTCSVKATVEYKVIANIKDEIKTEKEVNAAAEDANGNQAADVETGPVITDTVEWCESTKTANGEKYVEAIVDLTKTAKLDKEDSPLIAFVKNLERTSSKIFSRKTIAASPIFLTDVT